MDWDLILIMEPLTIGGALAGSFLNKVRAFCIFEEGKTLGQRRGGGGRSEWHIIY